MGNSHFVGRLDEINRLNAIVNEVNQGLGKMVLIQGNPGIGKSGLIREFFKPFENSAESICAISECNDKEGLNPYAPFKDLLLKLNAAGNSDSKEKKAQTQSKLKKFLTEAGTQWIGLIPVVGDFAQAGIETYKAYQQNFNEKQDNLIKTEDDIYRIFENEFRRLSKNKTLLIFIDDLQWADTSSLNLIFRLARSIRENPFRILIIGSYRQFDVEAGINRISETGENIKVRHPLADKLNELRNYTKQESHINRNDQWLFELSLNAFTATESEQLIKARFPKNNFSPAFYDDIFKLTDGHPLYLVEILDYLLKNNNIQSLPDGGFSAGPLNVSGLPVSVHAIINEKYERLSDDLKKVLSYASVSGEEFSVQEIEKVLKIDELDLLDYLEELSKKHGLLSAHEPVHVKNMLFELYRFSQTLVHKYIYENLDGARRRALHRKMAEIMQNLYGDEIDRNNEIKNKYNLHLQIGQGLIDGITLKMNELKETSQEEGVSASETLLKAAEAELVAAKENFEQFAASECLNRVNKALGFLSKIKENSNKLAELKFEAYSSRTQALQWMGHYNDAYSAAQEMLKTAGTLSNSMHTAHSNKALGNAVHFLGRYDEAIVYYNRALDIYKSENQYDMIIEALNEIARTKESQNLYDQAINSLTESLEYSKKVSNESKTGETLYLLAANHRKKGEHETASKFYLQALEISEKLKDVRQIGLIYNNMGLNFHSTGELNKAMDYIRKALAIAEQQNDRINVGNRLNNIGLTYEIMGNPEGAIEYYQNALDIDSSLDDKPKMAITFNNIGLVYASIGEMDKSFEYFNKSIEIYQSINDFPGLSFSYASIAQAFYSNGKHKESIAYYEKSLQIDLEIGDKVSLASNYNGIGNVHYSLENYEKANEFYLKALDIYVVMEDKLSIALLHNNLAGVAYSQQNNEKALEHYRFALSFYESTDDEVNIALLKGNIANTYNRLKEYDEAINAFEKAAGIYKKLKKNYDYACQLQGLGLCYFNMEKYDECIANLKESSDYFKKENNYFQLAINYRDIADAYKNKGKQDKAVEYYHLSIPEFVKAEDDYQAAQVWISLAWLHEENTDRESSIACFKEALNIMMQLNETGQVVEINLRLGNIYKSLEKFKKAESHFADALDFAHKIKDHWQIAKALKGLAAVEYNRNEYAKSKQYLLQSLDQHEHFDDLYEMADTYYELGTCIWSSDDFIEEREETIGYFNKAFDLFMDIDDDFNCSYCLYSLGSVYLEMGQNKTALNYLLKAKEMLTNFDPEYDVDFIENQIRKANDNVPPRFGKPGAV